MEVTCVVRASEFGSSDVRAAANESKVNGTAVVSRAEVTAAFARAIRTGVLAEKVFLGEFSRHSPNGKGRRIPAGQVAGRQGAQDFQADIVRERLARSGASKISLWRLSDAAINITSGRDLISRR